MLTTPTLRTAMLRGQYLGGSGVATCADRTMPDMSDTNELIDRYVAVLKQGGWAAQDARTDTAMAMLLSTLLVDALAREDFPGLFRTDPENAGREYAQGFLDALRGG